MIALPSPRPAGILAALRLAALLAILATVPPAGATLAQAGSPPGPTPGPTHGIAMHGEPKYPAGFAHFDYVNPQAPKGGAVAFGAMGSFDSLNPMVVLGVAATGLRDYVYESLMARSQDEPFSLYGLIAETIETPEDRSWVAFTLRPEARFSDGEPVTVEDVVFSHALLRDKGMPNHRGYYAKVTKVEQTGPRSVRFTFADDADREMPLILGLMPILPKHAIDPETFEQTTLRTPIASGPYVVAHADPGNRITYRRDPDYWGKDLPVNVGRFNFDEVRIDYFRDSNTLFEAFKKGLYDVRAETDPGRWATGYDFPAVRDGRVIMEELETGLPSGMSGFVFNTRKAPFDDIKVRKALLHLFDFEWINRNLYFGSYARTRSFFDNSQLSSAGRPADAAERALLAPFVDEVPESLLDGSYALPQSDGSGRNRASRRTAQALLTEAGYVLKDGVMTHKETGAALDFEILAATREQERLALTYARMLAGAGITARVRYVDSAQYQRRLEHFDFDMIQYFWFASLSPGNEQGFYWGSRAAGEQGSRNYMGAASPAVDAMIEALLAARSREDFEAAVRALDRALLAGHYMVPLFHLPKQWVARWSGVERPRTTPLYGYKVDAWWRDSRTGTATD